MRGLVFCLCFSASLLGYSMAYNEKLIVGYIEKVTLVEKNLTLPAKLDTGAKSASLNAYNIHKIELNGRPYLTFTVPSKEGDYQFRCEYVGEINIKPRPGKPETTNTIKKSIQRPVVLMKIRLGKREETIRVNLANRRRFIYPILLGREAIKAFNVIVDPSLKYTTKRSNRIRTQKKKSLNQNERLTTSLIWLNSYVASCRTKCISLPTLDS